MNAQLQQELVDTVTGDQPTTNSVILASRKVGNRPETTLIPPVDTPPTGPSKPLRDISEYERSAMQRIEVGLLTKRQIEAALVEQQRLVEIELASVRVVIAADEAALSIFNGAA